MLFITPTGSARGAKDYFTRALAPADYYVRDVEQPGEWHGLGAELLGLKGRVERDAFFRLCDNQDPATGERLTPRTKASRRVLYDFTFDAPKSVSLALELGGDERILDAFRASVDETMGEMEAQMQARVRRGASQEDRRTANMVWADFLHRTTRPVEGIPDPQLHCHAVVFNATYDCEEDRWKAGQFASLVRDKLYYQSAFHARLAARLTALGYDVRRDGTSFALAGIDRDTVLKFSRRLGQIEAAAARHGVTDARARGELGRRTRDAKAGGATLCELRAAWKARLTEAERGALASVGAGSAAPAPDGAAAFMHYAVSHCFERQSVLPERRLVAEALMHGVGKVAVKDVWKEAPRAGTVRRSVDGQVLTTTRDVYREELAMLAFAREGRGQCRRLGGHRTAALDPSLSEEQRQAALLLLDSRDRVVGLRGGAGTGKTRLLRATVAAIEASGAKVFTFAPSAKASRGVLREEGFADADTVERLLGDAELQKQVRGQVLLIDEAGLLSTPDMKRLFDLARDTGSRIVLSGDSAQHGAVGRGDALRLLEQEAGLTFARLTDIRRQTAEQYREAVREIARGDARGPDGRTMLEAGIARLDRMGAIHEIAGDDRLRRLAADYAAAVSAAGRDRRPKMALVVAPTHRECEQVAAHIREELKRRGRLVGPEHHVTTLKGLGLTEAQRSCADSYLGGEVIRFHQNAKGFARGERVTVLKVIEGHATVRRANGDEAELSLREAGKFEVYQAEHLALAAGDRLRITLNGFTAAPSGAATKHRLNNGDIFEVAGFTPQGDIRLSSGWVVPKDYGGLAQGYVVTSHASQGTTVDQVFIALGRDSLAAANRQQFYVSVSRGREAVQLYTDDKQALTEAVQADGARLSATELLSGATRKAQPRPAAAGRVRTLQTMHRARQSWMVRTRTCHWPFGPNPGEAGHVRG